MKKLFLSLVLIFPALMVFGQEVDSVLAAKIDSVAVIVTDLVNTVDTKVNDAEGLNLLVITLMTILTVLSGYLSAWIPWLKNFRARYRVFVMFLAFILAFTVFRGPDLTVNHLIEYLLSFGGATAIYIYVAEQFIKKSPAPANRA